MRVFRIVIPSSLLPVLLSPMVKGVFEVFGLKW
jgi:hypothetical protein